MKIDGAVALVTGASRGIGKQFVLALQKAGAARIYVGVRDPEKVAEIVSIDTERIIPIQLDITNEKLVGDAAAHCQDLTLLINNAGILLNKGLIAAPDLASARTEMEVNYFGTLSMCRAFAPILKTNGGGAIINVLSILARINFPPEGSYSASEAAALSLTQGVRAELAPQGTQVIAVMPGRVDTDMTKNETVAKVSPSLVVAATLQAVLDGVEEVYPDDEARSLVAQLTSDPKAVENGWRRCCQLLKLKHHELQVGISHFKYELGISMASLNGKVKIVTGSSRGIGRAVAERLSRGGTNIVGWCSQSVDSVLQLLAAT